MALRLVPFDSLARRLHQAVHALSAALGKDVHFEIVGGHVRVDRVVLDAMVDPLLHAVKNSLDHGLETAGERLASGKPPRGTLRLRLQRRADGVTIAIEDDGRGMHAGQLRRRAVALGLLDEAQSADLSDEQALMLTTLSGFTTARGINHVSGRGVGLDVVREAVESLGGALQIQSRPGCGTELLLSLPPGQALIQTLLVRCAGELYAVPLDAVQRVVDLRRENPFVARGIHDSEVPRPLRLDDHLGIAGHEQRPRRADRALVLSQGPPRLALVVDEVLGRRDVVVKALSTGLAGLQPYSGAALLADGTIALVLDAQALGAG